MNIEKRIGKIKAKLILEQPYFGTIASSLKIKLNENIQSFQTSDNNFEYNDTFIETLCDEQLSFILTNCSMHYALEYKDRQENRIEWLWKLAQDYAINSLLVSNGLTPPLIVNHDIRFNKLSAESIYIILQDEIDNKEKIHEKIEHIKVTDISKKEGNSKKNIEQIINKAIQYGDIPLDLELLIPNLYEGQIDWKDEIYDVIEQSIKFDYTLIPPNKRYISRGIALPSLSGTMARIVIAIDSSGSIDEHNLKIFLSEVQSILNQFENFEIDLIIADAKVQEHIVLYPGDDLIQNIKGGGGTNFEETFTYIEQNIYDISLFLYFTDGAGKFPEDKFNFETVWILNNKEIEVPFGRTIFLI